MYTQPFLLPLKSLFSSISAKNIHLSESFPRNHDIKSRAFDLRLSWW